MNTDHPNIILSHYKDKVELWASYHYYKKTQYTHINSKDSSSDKQYQCSDKLLRNSIQHVPVGLHYTTILYTTGFYLHIR